MNNLRTLGLGNHRTPSPLNHLHRPAQVVAAAPRNTTAPTALESAHVLKMLSASFNIEESADYLESTPHYSGQLRDDMRAVRKAAKRVNERMMAESHPELNTAINTLNSRGNLANRVNLLLCLCPEEVAEAAANALAEVIEKWRNPPPPRKARRTKQSLKQAA